MSDRASPNAQWSSQLQLCPIPIIANKFNRNQWNLEGQNWTFSDQCAMHRDFSLVHPNGNWRVIGPLLLLNCQRENMPNRIAFITCAFLLCAFYKTTERGLLKIFGPLASYSLSFHCTHTLLGTWVQFAKLALNWRKSVTCINSFLQITISLFQRNRQIDHCAVSRVQK